MSIQTESEQTESEQPEVATPAPLRGSFKVSVSAGKRYLWCACGRSRKQPFCDGAHAVSSILPYFYRPEQTAEVLMCGCKRTKTPPLCDGSQGQRCAPTEAQSP
jgi:CDGSH-type Zn-finger protein